MLKTQVGVVRVGNVPGGDDVGVGSGQVFVDDDAVVDVQSGRLGQRGVGCDAHADHDGVGVDHAAVGKTHPGGAAVRPGDFFDAGAQTQSDAVCAVQGSIDLGHLAAQHLERRQLTHLDHGDLTVGGPGGGGGFQPDPARPMIATRPAAANAALIASQSARLRR